STLSVSTVNSISPFSMRSPGCFSHVVTAPSVMVRPSCGMMISYAVFCSKEYLAAYHRADLRYNLFDSRDHLALEHRTERIRHVLGADPPGRRVQAVERLLARERE